jgi:endonuclease/exonuclease/phosphatase (EEP) superfamily protein YafD
VTRTPSTAPLEPGGTAPALAASHGLDERPRKAVPRVAWGAAGLVLIGLLGVAGARVVDWDGTPLTAWADAATPWIYLPAWPIAVLAAWRRRWLWAAMALVVVVAQAAWELPELMAPSSEPPPPGSVELRVLDANVESTNPSMAGYERAITRARPDLVVLEEATPTDISRLASSPSLATLPHRLEFANGASRGIFVASRAPLDPDRVFFVDGLAYLMESGLVVGGRHVPLWVVHTTAPVGPWWPDWNRELDGIAHHLAASGASGALVLGDFNATWGNRGFQSIRGTGLVDAAAALGQALQMTWPQTGTLVPPLVRIDHVMTGRGLVVRSLVTEEGPGSDHHTLVAEVAVAPLAGSSSTTQPPLTERASPPKRGS